MNAGLYVRISTDREEETSTTTQEQRCREYAISRGWQVVDVYVDRGRSAFKTNGKRPALDRLMADVEAGIVDVVVVWKLDRWSRSASDWYRLWDRLQRAGCAWVSVTDAFDTTTAMGEAMQAIGVTFARLESAIKSERITEWHKHRQAIGATPNAIPAFGYRKVGNEFVVVKEEAELIQDAARRILDGASVRSIVTEWNKQGIVTRRGKPWAHSVFLNLMRRPTLTGCRMVDKVLIPGRWEAILDRETHENLISLFGDPRRRVGRQSQTALLAGVIHCAECGHRMKSRAHRGGRRYFCREPYGATNGPCGRVSIVESAADGYVSAAVIGAVGKELPAIETHDPQEVDHLEAELSALAADYGNGLITRAQWIAARTGLDHRLNEAIARASRATAAVPADLEAAWPTLTVAQRRSIILTLVEKVTVTPGYSKQDRIKITWKV